MSLGLYPCISCGRPKVVKTGDYCVDCALQWVQTVSEHEYIIISPATLNLAEQRSGVTREYMFAKMERAFENYQHYVIFFAKGGWREIVISDRFYIPVIMQNLFEQLED